jgi:hypothetical protein
MRSMTVKEARDSFDRMLEAAKREGVVLRDDGKEVAVVVSPSDAELIRRAKAIAAVKARDELAEGAQDKGLTEQILVEIMNERT